MLTRSKRSVSYSSFPVLPPKGFDVAITPGAGATTVVSNVLREGSSGTTTQAYHSAYVFPEVMYTGLFSVTAGNAAQSTTSRGIGAGMFSDDGTKGVFFTISGNTTSCRIYTWTGAVLTQQASANVFSTSSSDLIKLVPTLSGGVITWTVYKNNVATAVTWADSTHVTDLPGRRFAACFRHEYSGSQFNSPAIKSMAAADL